MAKKQTVVDFTTNFQTLFDILDEILEYQQQEMYAAAYMQWCRYQNLNMDTAEEEEQEQQVPEVEEEKVEEGDEMELCHIVHFPPWMPDPSVFPSNIPYSHSCLHCDSDIEDLPTTDIISPDLSETEQEEEEFDFDKVGDEINWEAEC